MGLINALFQAVLPSSPLAETTSYPVVWIYGIPGAGKTTVGQMVAEEFSRPDRPSMFLDAEDMRVGLCKGLGYTPEDRLENVRRIAECARLIRQVAPVVVAAVTPGWRMRQLIHEIIPDCRLAALIIDPEVAEKRGKGLWQGTHFDYPRPSESPIIVDATMSPRECCKVICEEVGW